MFLPEGESLPSPLQVKLGTKSMCIFFLVLFHSRFCFLLLFFFLLLSVAGGEGKGSWLSTGPNPPPVSSDQQTVQDGGSALLQPTIVQCCWLVCGEEASLLVAPRDPSWGVGGCAALGQLGSHVTARRIVPANHCCYGGGVIKNTSYSGPDNSSLLPQRSHFFPFYVLFFPPHPAVTDIARVRPRLSFITH